MRGGDGGGGSGGLSQERTFLLKRRMPTQNEHLSVLQNNEPVLPRDAMLLRGASGGPRAREAAPPVGRRPKTEEDLLKPEAASTIAAVCVRVFLVPGHHVVHQLHPWHPASV